VSLLLSAGSLEPRLSALVVPLATDAPGFESRPSVSAALVLVTDPTATPSLARAMRESYGLTPAEARLAQRLVGGSTLLEAAEDLQIRQSTARTQLRAALGKMGVRRQAELVRVALSLPAAAVERTRDEQD
jgi:DNA-binding CsgD family transcriptional regulator